MSGGTVEGGEQRLILKNVSHIQTAEREGGRESNHENNTRKGNQR